MFPSAGNTWLPLVAAGACGLAAGLASVRVRRGLAGVHWANVCLHAPGEAYLLNLSNDIGRCDFVVPEDASGKITATKHNWVPAQESFVAE